MLHDTLCNAPELSITRFLEGKSEPFGKLCLCHVSSVSKNKLLPSLNHLGNYSPRVGIGEALISL